MKKKLIIITLLLIFFLGFTTSKMTYKYAQIINRLKYKVSINGTQSSTFPSRGDYSVNVSCTNNSNIKWDYDDWKLSINPSVTDDCYIEFNSITNKQYISDYIKSKVGTTQGADSSKGQIVNENGYRYEGSDPYNYVLFNNELWRIIGVFDTTLADGSTVQSLTKIIRSESIGSYVFNSNNKNYWLNTSGTRSSLNILLNDYYYQGLDGTSNSACRLYSSITGNCDYRVTGINENYRSMVEYVTWNLGGIKTASWIYDDLTSTADATYADERGTATYSGNATTSTGYIGLMYPSDYGYSVLESSCARTTSLGSYGTAACAGKAWMLKNGYEWTIAPYSSNSDIVWNVSIAGEVVKDSAGYGYAVRPVLYLKSTVYIVSGDGSQNNPYIING